MLLFSNHLSHYSMWGGKINMGYYLVRFVIVSVDWNFLVIVLTADRAFSGKYHFHSNSLFTEMSTVSWMHLKGVFYCLSHEIWLCFIWTFEHLFYCFASQQKSVLSCCESWVKWIMRLVNDLQLFKLITHWLWGRLAFTVTKLLIDSEEISLLGCVLIVTCNKPMKVPSSLSFQSQEWLVGWPAYFLTALSIEYLSSDALPQMQLWGNIWCCF